VTPRSQRPSIWRKQLGKTPIVVNDAPGFFTTRVIGKTVAQGAAMVLEGIDPVLIEAAARANGSPVGPLAAIDEVSQETAYRNGLQMKADVEARGETWQEQPCRGVDTAHGRRLRAQGQAPRRRLLRLPARRQEANLARA
jgi:3-hydroxyacyl-CoA dehydrogenase